MLGRIGALAISRQYRRHQSATATYTATGIVVSLTGSCLGLATQCQQNQIFSPGTGGGNQLDVLVPTLEATVRALRLVRTAILIVVDYQAEKFKSRLSVGSTTDAGAELEALQTKMERKEADLERAQMEYANGKVYPDLSPEERRTLKERQKIEMHQAASQLAEIEEQITEMEGVSSKSQLHRKSANRLLDLCRQNGGVYIKVGQHLANLDYLIPQEYIDVLSSLFDDTPRSTFDDVCQVIEEDLGGSIDDIFDRFEEKPIASASLAQVHVAYHKKTGKKLAVKVQHRGLRETSAGDVLAVTKVVALVENWFEDFTFGWIADEIAPHLPRELDFTLEGMNAEKAALHVAKTGLRCVIPKVVWNMTAPRVLTMEFEEGFKATDKTAIENSGLNKHDIAKLISSVFNSQVFLSAWVHCDPHPANVLLRTKNGKPEMVLVDHGLYKAIDDTFRVRYARLWRSLMMADLNEIQVSCHDMGVDQAYPLFAAMLTARPFDEIIERSKTGSFTSSGAAPESQADRAVIRGYAKQFMKDIFILLGTLPPQMLLLLKMNDCLRHIDFALGSPANTLVIAGKYASRAVYEDQAKNLSTIGKISSWIQYVKVLFRIHVYDLGIWLRRIAGSSNRSTYH